MKKNKKIISIILTSFMILSIVVSSLVPTISSYAESNEYDFIELFGLTETSVLTREDFLNSDVYDSAYSNRFISSNASAVSTYRNYIVNYPNLFKVSMDSTLLCDEVFCSVTTDTATSFNFNTYPSGSYVLFGTNGDYCVICPTDYEYATVNGYKATGGCTADNNTQSGRLVYSYLTETTMGGQTVVRTDIYTNNSAMFFISSLPIKYYNGRLNGNTNLNNISDFDLNFNPVGSSNNHENIVNHLTLRDGSKFYISNSSFDNGTVYLYPILDTTQMGDNESLDEYYFRFVGTVQTNNYYNSLAAYHCLAPNGNRITNYFPMSSGTYNGYDFSLRTTDGNYYDVPVKEVKNGSWSMALSTLNDMFYSNTDYSYHNLAYAYDTAYDGTTAWDTTKNVISAVSVGGVQFDANKITDGQADVVPNKVLYHIDLYIVKKNVATDEVSIGDVQSYIDGDICLGGLTGGNVNTSSDDDVKNALGTNYIPNGYNSVGGTTNYKDTYNNVGGSGGSASADNSSSNNTTGGSANIGDGAIVINNNPTFNNDVSATSESKTSGFGGFLSTLITLIASGKTSSVETISSISGTTGYTELVTSYIGTIPVSLWTTIIVTFTACLGISIIAFIISLLFKIFF